MSQADLVIIGAGPAGIGAALEAADAGLSVVLLDENPAPGGRIWQALERRGARNDDDKAALAQIARLRNSKVDARYGATVWAVEPDRTIFYNQDGKAHSIQAKTLLVATGAMERPMPVEGWIIPGAMPVGAAQILMKTADLVPSRDKRTYLAGQGPLLLLYANQVLDAGGKLAAILDMSPPGRLREAVRHLTRDALPDLWKGMRWRWRVRRAKIPWRRVTRLQVYGYTVVEWVIYWIKGERTPEEAYEVLLHDGVIPSTHLTRALGCAHEWNEAQRCLQPVVDEWGNSSVPAILVAGDTAGIGGADVALLSGRIAVLGLLGQKDKAAPLMAQRKKRLAIRPFLDALYPPLAIEPTDDTVVCRCEEVTAGEVRKAARAGCQGLNQLKAYTRCGMGPCQGRYCEPVTRQVLAAARGVPEGEIDSLRVRFPIKPVPVDSLLDAQV